MQFLIIKNKITLLKINRADKNLKQQNMKKIILICILTVLTAGLVNAQNKTKTYAKLFYNNTEITDNPNVSISVQSAVANDKQVKFKFKVVNKTHDFILVKFSECKFVNGDKQVMPNEKDLLISPIENDFRVVNIMGVFNSSEHCNFIVDGIYKILSKGNSITCEDFNLPSSKTEFSVGPFNIKNTDIYKQTDATKLKFNVAYTGTKTGFIFTDKPTVLMPDNNEYPCAKSNGLFSGPSLIVLKAGSQDSYDITWDRMPNGKITDMQKVNMIVKWHDTFCEMDPPKIKSITVPFDINLSLSK